MEDVISFSILSGSFSSGHTVINFTDIYEVGSVQALSFFLYQTYLFKLFYSSPDRCGAYAEHISKIFALKNQKYKRVFAYEAHTACDKNGFVLETVVTAGNVHDSVAFDDVYDNLTEKYPKIETIVTDSAYKTPHICKKVFDDNRVLSTAYKRPMTMKGGHEWWKYVYDEYYDCVICPEYQVLKYRTTNRDGYREYKSNPEICKNCPTRELCTKSKDCVKVVIRHIWKDYEEHAEDVRHTPKYKELYRMRKEKIERVFADAKEKHAMRYTPYTGLAQVSNRVRLKFAAMNLKKFAKWKWNSRKNHLHTFIYFANTKFFKKIPALHSAKQGFSTV